jgi:uncharacterized protein with beta-barrel porin domain
LAGVALAAAAMTSSAVAQSIDTTGQWNGVTSIDPWGVPPGVTPTYGETITATSTQDRLTSFTFELARESGTAPQYQAFVYQFNAATKTIVGPALFSSGIFTAPSGTTFSAVTINTGSISLTPGQQYVLFFTTSNITGQATASYKFGQVTNTTAYAGGQFVFNNSAAFGSLSTVAWTTSQPNDLAFMASLLPNSLVSLLPTGAAVNPTNVAAAIDNASNSGAIVPPGFNNLYSLSGQQLTEALSQLSGEAATGAQGASFELTNSFMALLTGPSGSSGNGGGPAMPFAPERADAFPPDVALAYASALKAPVYKAPVAYAPRWTSWGAAFGGGSTTSGDPSAVGSHDVSSHTGGFASGLDYHVTPDTIVGLALAGGATAWSLSGGVGGGHSDVFLAGLYGSKQLGQAYLSGALTFSSDWVRTNRTIAVAGTDTLNASFNAQSFGGRLEGGYRIPSALAFTVTPYAAMQVQSFRSPGYGETGTLGTPDPMALTFASQTAIEARSELGGRFDELFAQADGRSVDLFGRLAWAHDWQSNPNLTATFIGLPTATFVVNGATPPADLALLTAGAEWRSRTGWAVMAKFDGEFASRSQTYTGTARIKYSW